MRGGGGRGMGEGLGLVSLGLVGLPIYSRSLNQSLLLWCWEEL